MSPAENSSPTSSKGSSPTHNEEGEGARTSARQNAFVFPSDRPSKVRWHHFKRKAKARRERIFLIHFQGSPLDPSLSYAVVAWDLDTTGRRLLDEIGQIGAFTTEGGTIKEEKIADKKVLFTLVILFFFVVNNSIIVSL